MVVRDVVKHHNEHIKDAFRMGTKFVLCVGASEASKGTVTVMMRPKEGQKKSKARPMKLGEFSIQEVKTFMDTLFTERTKDEDVQAVAKSVLGVPEESMESLRARIQELEQELDTAYSKVAQDVLQEAGLEDMVQEAETRLQGLEKNEGVSDSQTAAAVKDLEGLRLRQDARPKDVYYVKGDAFQTTIARLQGKSFSTLGDYSDFMNA